MAELSTADINDLPDDDFAYIESGGSKDSSGKTVPRSLRHFPVHDAAHVRNALARAPRSPFGKQAMPKIEAAAHKFGIDVGGDSSRSEMFTRTWEISDISVRTEGEGRTVDAYAAIFDSPAYVRDQDGEYMEEIDRHAFDGAVRSMRGPMPVLFNHGRTLYGTPSERYSIPIGVSEEVRPDGKGLFTRSRYHKTEAADEVLEAIRDGSITAYSFQGQFMRSSPGVPRGGFRKQRGELPTVKRTECTLREYGPGTFAVYKDAAIMGVRAEDVAHLLNNLEHSERSRLLDLLSDSRSPQLEASHREVAPKEKIRATYARFLSSRKD